MKQRLLWYSRAIRCTFERRSPILDILYLAVAILVFCAILLDRSSDFLRILSLPLRAGLNLTVVLYFVCLYIAFRLKGWAGQVFSLVLSLALFAFALAGLWAIGQSQSTVFNGIVPLFDARSYYGDALRLLAGQDFTSFSARRPLFAGLFSVLLWISNRNLMTALSILTLMTALACFVTVKQIQRTHGSEVAVFVLIILFLFYRYHSGLVMTENLGLPLGALGFALIWRGAATRNRFALWVGLFLFTLGLNARAGAFLTLPLLVLWYGWAFKDPARKFSWSFFAIGITAVLAGFVINLLMVRLLATPSGMPFSNFSYSLYGLASGGKSWTYVLDAHPELSQLQEPYLSRQIYKLAFELIRDQPVLLIKGALYNWSMLFSNTWYNAYSFVTGENEIVRLVAQCSILVLCVLGFVRWIRKPEDTLNGLVVIAAIGTLVSAPFLPPTDAYRMRPYATSMIVFGLLPAMGLLFGLEMLKIRFVEKKEQDDTYPGILIFLVILLLFSTTVGPVLIKNFGELPEFQQVTCEKDLDLVSLRFDPGTYFSIVRQDEPELDGMPNFHLGRFRRNSHSLAHSEMIRWTGQINAQTSIFAALNFRSLGNVLVVTPTKLLPAPGTLWQVCGQWERDKALTDYRIFYVRMGVNAPTE